MAADAEGNVLLAHASLRRVFVLGPQGEVIATIVPCRGATVTNIAFGGPASQALFAKESSSGTIFAARWRAAGLPTAGFQGRMTALNSDAPVAPALRVDRGPARARFPPVPGDGKGMNSPPWMAGSTPPRSAYAPMP